MKIATVRLSGVVRWMAIASLVLTGLSCSDDSGAPTGPQDPVGIPDLGLPQLDHDGLVVTEPVGADEAPQSSNSVSFSMLSFEGSALSYVSFAPGTHPAEDSVEIRNWTEGISVGARLVDGGLDPIAIPASVGDTLVITTFRNGAGREARAHEVPARKPPVVVRTDPPSKKTRVPLNAVIVIVFSEPVDETTVNQSSVRLLNDFGVVPAGFNLSADEMRLEVRPQEDLKSSQTYTIVVEPTVSDLNGDSLNEKFTSVFTTVDEGPTRTVESWNGQIALLSNRAAEAGGFDLGPWQIYLAENSAREFLQVDTLAVETPYPYRIGPQLSPDGERIAFLHYGDIWLVDAAGGDLVNLTSSGDVNSPPEWAPDSERIVYTAGVDAQTVRILAVDGSGPPIEVGAGTGNPAWSPDGSYIAFDSPSEQIAVVRPDGSDLTLVGIHGPSWKYPRWSPDGSRLVFGFGGVLYVVNADGSGQKSIVDLPGSAARPQWSPDGSKIAYLRSPPGCFSYCVLAVADTTGKGLFEIHDFKNTEDFHLIWPLVWSPDGSRLAFSVRWFPIDAIFMVDSDGGNLARITDGESASDLDSYIIGSWVD